MQLEEPRYIPVRAFSQADCQIHAVKPCLRPTRGTVVAPDGARLAVFSSADINRHIEGQRRILTRAWAGHAIDVNGSLNRSGIPNSDTIAINVSISNVRPHVR